MGVKLGLTLREESRLREFEYRVLRKIFGPEKKQVTGGWRRLHSEQLYDLQVIISQRLRWAGHVAHMGDKRVSYRVFVGGTANGKRPLGRPKYRWEDNVKNNLQKVGWGGKDWFDLAKDRDRWQAVVNAVTSSGSRKCREFFDKPRDR